MDSLRNQLDIVFYSNQIFEEWKKINNLAKRAEAIGTLTVIMNGEKPGGGAPQANSNSKNLKHKK